MHRLWAAHTGQRDPAARGIRHARSDPHPIRSKPAPGVPRRISYVRSARDGQLDLPGAMAELYERLGVRTLLCEGGPHLNAQLLVHGLVDELFLTLSPKLAGGDAVSKTLRIVSGPEFDPPLELELAGVLEHDSYLFLR